MDKYFDQISASALVALCHGDFTQGNIMIEDVKEDENSQRCSVGFIDWQSYFLGNGFVDLSFFLLYGVDHALFQTHPDLYKSAFDFYCLRLSRHGFDPSLHKFNGTKDSLFKLFQQGTFFAFMRYISGFGGWLPHAEENDRLKIKFRNCLNHCLAVYHEVKKTTAARGEKRVRIVYSSREEVE